jgi:hypothetical protein
LALQDQLLELYKLVRTGLPLEPDARAQVQEATAKIRLLASRVEDNDTRKEVTAFLRTADQLARPSTFIQRMQTEDAAKGYTRATNLIGRLLRERY